MQSKKYNQESNSILVLITLSIITFFNLELNAQDLTNSINTVALQNGSYMYQTPASYVTSDLMVGKIKNYTPEALLDLSSKVWCSPENEPYPHTFIIELTETFVIDKLVFDNVCEDYSGISAKDVTIEFLTKKPVENSFNTLGTYQLKSQALNEFDIMPQEAKYIKISILSNHGNQQFTELAEFKAYGKYLNNDIDLIQIGGKWETNWGSVSFEQMGTLINGEYVYNDGHIKYGGINRNSISFRWIERELNREGSALLFMNEEGTRLTGIWCNGDDWNDYGFWIMERRNGIPYKLSNKERMIEKSTEQRLNLTEESKSMIQEIQATIEEEEKIILHGIYFPINSAEISSDSYIVLNNLASILKSNKEISILIEGHTDNVGSDEHNLKLSLQRAIAVKNYLTKLHEIDESRLAVNGKGESSPISDNKTESGKIINRRVEIHRIR